MRALVVASSRPHGEALASLLAELGVEAVVARGPDEALDLVRARRVDVVLSDVVDPRLDGFSLRRALQREAARASVPFVSFRGRAFPWEAVRAVDVRRDALESALWGTTEAVAAG